MTNISLLRKSIPMPVKRAARLARRALKAAVGKDHLMACDVTLPKRRYGRDWADWVLAPQYLNSHSIVYSFGLGRDISFELSLIGDVGCEIHGFDPTPISLEYVRSLGPNPKFHVHTVGLSTFDGEKEFGAPTEGDFSFSTQFDDNSALRLPVRRLASLAQEFHHDHIDLLKMDIEGEEYGVIDDMLAQMLFPRQLLVEFHHAWNIAELRDTKAAVQKLHSAGYMIFDISAAGREFSFAHSSLL
jgi:FkbM family methyltransferase